MKKVRYYHHDSGKTIRVGQPLTVGTGKNCVSFCSVSLKDLDYLVEKHLIGKEEISSSAPKDLGYYEGLIAKVHNWDEYQQARFFSTLREVWPPLYYFIILRAIAEVMDDNYPDHIRNSKHIYTVSLITNSVYGVYKGAASSWQTFAAFRSIEEAEEARRILRPFVDKYLNNGRK